MATAQLQPALARSRSIATITRQIFVFDPPEARFPYGIDQTTLRCVPKEDSAFSERIAVMLFAVPEIDRTEQRVIDEIDQLWENLRYQLGQPRRW